MAKSLSQILEKPPSGDIAIQITVVIPLILETTADNLDKVVDYVTAPQFSRDFEVLIILEIAERNPAICEAPAFHRWAKQCERLKIP